MPQIPARRWLGLPATPYRREQLGDVIALHLGPIRHTSVQPRAVLARWAAALQTPNHRNRSYRSTRPTTSTPATPIRPHRGGIAAICRDLIADDARTDQVTDDDVVAAVAVAGTAWCSPGGPSTSTGS